MIWVAIGSVSEEGDVVCVGGVGAKAQILSVLSDDLGWSLTQSDHQIGHLDKYVQYI